jgi:hypothetical protein
MTKLQTTKRHGDPTLDVSREEDQRPVFNDQLQVRVEELEDEVEVRL